MEPPICKLCHEDFDPSGPGHVTGGLLTFRPAPDHEPLPEGMTGHPENMAWFCARHWPAAAALEQLTLGEALARLRGGQERGSP